MFRANLSAFKTANKKFLSTVAGAVPEYATSVKFFHWTMGGLMMGCVGSVLYAQKITDKKEKADTMFLHKSFGLLAAGLLVPRLLARFASKSPGPLIGASTIENIGGNISHLAMYGFVIVLPVTGVVMGSFSGFGLPFFFTTFPSIRKEPAIAKQAYEIHKLAGQAFEYFIPIHVGGAFYHVFRGHKVFARIAGIGNTASKVAK